MSTNSGLTMRTILFAAAGLLGVAASRADAQITLQRSGTPLLPKTLPLAAPSGVTVAATRGGIAIGWQGVVGAGSYEIQRAPDATSAAATVGTVPATAVSFVDPTMSAQGPAWYQVVTVAADGRRAASGRVQLAATAPVPIDKTALRSRFGAIAAALPVSGAPPTGVRAESAPTRIGIRWTCPAGATGFDVSVTPQGGGEVKLTSAPVLPPCIQDAQLSPAIAPGALAPTSTAPSYSLGYTHSGVTPGSTYTYVVRALYSNGASGASSPLTVTAPLAPPPASFVASASGRSATLQWKPVSGATGYKVFRKLAGQTAFQELPPALGSVATGSSDPSLLPPGQHQYYVQAVNGLPSQPASVTIPPLPAPPAFNVRAPSSNEVDLSWQLPFDLRLTPRGYHVYRQREGEAGYSQLTATPVTALSYQDLGLAPGRRVTYYVKGVDADPTPSVSVVPGTITSFCVGGSRGSSTLEFAWSGTAGASAMQLFRAEAAGGPFAPVVPYYATATMARTSQNPIGVTQYFKLAAIYGTVALESNILAVTILPGIEGFSASELPISVCAPGQ
jgi:fibronectin type III domain protein